MTESRKCISCGTPIIGKDGTTFTCPNCGKVKISRCNNCRVKGAKYLCPECGFMGP